LRVWAEEKNDWAAVAVDSPLFMHQKEGVRLLAQAAEPPVLMLLVLTGQRPWSDQ
jgi:hypothetical protein